MILAAGFELGKAEEAHDVAVSLMFGTILLKACWSPTRRLKAEAKYRMSA